MESADTIAGHILALYGAKITEYTNNTGHLNIDLQKKNDASALYIHSSEPGTRNPDGCQWERQIDELYLNKSSVESAFRLETYRSTGSLEGAAPERLRCYFLQRCQFTDIGVDIPKDTTVNIRSVSDKTFLNKASDNTLAIYQNVMDEVICRLGPCLLYTSPSPRD